MSCKGNPTSQCRSAFFHFRVSRERKDPTLKNSKDYVIDQCTRRDYPQINFISPNGIAINKTTGFLEGNATAIVQGTLNEYDFIGVSERLCYITI